MSGFDRSKVKGSSIAALKETRKKAEKKSNVFGGQNDRPGFHKIEEGMNVFRIAPPHDPNDPPYQPVRTAWLTCELPELDDEGKETGKTVEKKKRIFIATIHGKDLKEDPIETYIKYVINMANDQIANEDERKKFLAPVMGWTGKDKKWNPGMRPNTNYVFYAWKDGELGRIEMYPSILKKMEELNISEDAEDIIEVDCFSDPDNGVHLLIDYDKSAKKNEKYKVKKREFNRKKYKTWDDFMEEERVSDVKLEEWFGKASLRSMYKDVYTMKDFDLALNGLAVFDEQNEYGIFENEEFIADIEEMRKYVPEKTDQQAVVDGDDIEENFNKSSKKTNTSKKENENVSSESQDEDTSSWSKIKCKKYLMAYIEENYGETIELPELSVSEIREWAALAVAGEELPFPQEEEEESNPEKDEDNSEQEKEEVKASKTITNSSVADRIAKMRAKKESSENN